MNNIEMLKKINKSESDIVELNEQLEHNKSVTLTTGVNIKFPISPYTPAYSDGVTDNGTIIQNFIDNFNDIYLPNGVYKISSSLVFNRKGVKFVGESKENTIILVENDIDVIQLWARCTIENITIKINSATHSKSAIKYFAVQNGNSFGQMKNIKIDGTGFTNNTKALEFAGDPSGTGNPYYYFYFWNFENFEINNCFTAWYTEADFNKYWTTATTFKNFILLNCIRAVYFNGIYVQGWYSRIDFIEWQYQTHSNMGRVFEAPTDRSIVDIHVWDKGFYPGTPKAFYIKESSINNLFKLRNIRVSSEVEFENSNSAYMNTFEVVDDPYFTKNIVNNTTVYIDNVNGEDKIGNGTQDKPLKTLKYLFLITPRKLNSTLVIVLNDGVYSEDIIVPNFYGNGELIIKGQTTNVKVNSLNITNNKVKTTIQNLVVTNVSNDIAVLLADSSLTYFENVSIVPSSATATYGYYIQNSKALLRGEFNIENCTNAIYNSGGDLAIYTITGKNNSNGITTINNGSTSFRTPIPTTFATNLFVTNLGGFVNPRISGFGLVAISSGATSKVVTHNFGEIPTYFNITPQGNVGYVWVSNCTTTQFTINCSNAPSSAVQIGWEAKCM